MRYCTRCVNPENLYGGITFDEMGICSRCREWESYEKTFRGDAKEQERKLLKILESYRNKDGSNYDMIIPVSGGKDSLYQVHLIKKEYGFNPLLVTFNHTFNTATGIFNLNNMIEKLGVDHIRFTPNPQIISTLVRKSLAKFGDMCWHCHCGIFTFPLRLAVGFRIPLIICQEKYYGILSANGGSYTKIDNRDRLFGIRAEAEEMVDETLGIELKDLVQWRRPSQKEIDQKAIRGICITDFIKWDSKEITEFLIKEYGFKTREHDRTYDCYANVECHHCSGSHDYLRYLKVGHGRVTDDVGIDIRKGLMTRKKGVELVEKYDSARPNDLDIFLERVDMSEEEFLSYIDDKRDSRIWTRTHDGNWEPKDSVSNHKSIPGAKEAGIALKIRGSYKRINNIADCRDDKHVIV